MGDLKPGIIFEMILKKGFHILRRLIPAALILTALGCTSIGPESVPRDRFDYASAIRDSWKHELLQNIVNMRYGGIPVFVDVASVISQYELQGSVAASATANGSVVGDDIYGIGGNARYTERPTITYQPLTGPKFSRSLLTPIKPATLLFLAQAGYPIDMLMQIGARSINGIKNRANTELIKQDEDPLFSEVLAAMRRIQLSGLIGIRLEKKNEKDTTVMFFGKPSNEDIIADVKFVRETLGLNPEADQFALIFGPVSPGPDILAIQSRSMMEIMLELSAEVDAPAVHIEQGLTFPTVPEDHKLGFLTIHSQSEPPSYGYAAMQFQDHWFWVDDRDIQSKRMLTLLVVLSSLTESDTPAQVPVVTVGAGS